jgi:hypothetical protein
MTSSLSCKQVSIHVLSMRVKDMLKTKIVQILFSQIGKNYVKYRVETFTLDILTIAYQIGSMV